MKEAAGQKGMFRTSVDHVELSRSSEWLLSFRGSPLGQCGWVARHDTFLTPHWAAPGAFNVDLDINFIRTD
jgi:hypothetical protein